MSFCAEFFFSRNSFFTLSNSLGSLSNLRAVCAAAWAQSSIRFSASGVFACNMRVFEGVPVLGNGF